MKVRFGLALVVLAVLSVSSVRARRRYEARTIIRDLSANCGIDFPPVGGNDRLEAYPT
jgi:hypothetical protein